ncbi:Uncharacterised protein [Serratia quinivorans]|uniref:Uncharacterized protein n=1 Tax=Serratia quinivorans TaxID=137545 RepID=A0A380AV59_9GAMM|nr:hypothetical protein [Serratia proteamaculans]RYM60186.1 hypothetical protein BSR03_17230 [Serratia proteamaculans]SUI88292.1 Uncharacterised protein [Serratia quinivorans]
MNAAKEQVAAAKLKQKQDAMRRARQQLPGKSMMATMTTAEQSEVTERPPNLYRAPKINPPSNLMELTRLLQQELTKIEMAQSYLLTLWKKTQEQQEN